MKIGDTVLCVKSHRQQATIKGKEYEVEGRIVCKCGAVALMLVGVLVPDNTHGVIECFCGEDAPTEGHWYQGAGRFVKRVNHTFTNEITRKLINTPLVEEKVEKIKEKELETV